MRARILLVRALLECRNAERAAEEFAQIPDDAVKDPSVRALAGCVAMSSGRYAEAILQFHLLTTENPDWADAWVNLAWANFMLEPEFNRESSVAYYRNALMRGAKRDPELERRLRIRIGEN